MTDWDEAAWFGDCANTFHEEQKQLVYATRMGLVPIWDCAHPPTFDLGGRSVVDIGGGPCSLLLKCVNFSHAFVLDPGEWPAWVDARYSAHGVEHICQGGERPPASRGALGCDVDEAWVYNCLQHVDDPASVVWHARSLAATIRLFEWIDVDPYPGHPHRLEQATLDEWLGSTGFVADVNEQGAVGRAYYGVFAAAEATLTV